MKACPEIAEYAASGINNWRDLMTTAAQLRATSAYEDALVFGQKNTDIDIAYIMQPSKINSAGGYLRDLAEKTRAGEFSVGQMLMAALKAKGVQPQLVMRHDWQGAATGRTQISNVWSVLF
ncbi:replication initiation protein RepC [Phyllobacterium endophyticum]|uniref:replication initiation protein RepC n=1 Tax=Phyllobacterium endophyticum TaxID=1149773 RepID=UPI0031BB89AF